MPPAGGKHEPSSCGVGWILKAATTFSASVNGLERSVLRIAVRRLLLTSGSDEGPAASGPESGPCSGESHGMTQA